MRLLLSLLLLLLVLAPAAFAADRTTEVVRLDCGTRADRRDVTLFANGTVRLREGPRGFEEMGLAELGPVELEGFLRRLAEEDLSEVEHLPRGVDGEGIEVCRLDLRLPDRPARSWQFGRYDTLPLSLSRVLRVVEDLAARVGDLREHEELPAQYEPRKGDVLKRIDGQLYEVVGFTSDNKGLELWGVDQPLTLYVSREEVRREFVALVRRR